MDKKPKADDSKSILDIIIFAGVILDSYSVYSGWKEINNEKSINDFLSNNGLASSGLGIEETIGSLQKGLSILLIVFLIFDFVAYYNLYDYKNWARKYVMSIAIFYLVGCIFSFSLPYFAYSVFTIYYLWNPPQEFLGR
jgi:hypothetical protein